MSKPTVRQPVLISFLLFLLRVSLGSIMLTLGIRLLLEGGWKAWMRIGGILPTVVRGPFEGLFLQTWESPVVLYLVIGGALAIGTAMVLGCCTRLAALGGAARILSFYLATIPPQFGWVNQYFIYFGAFVNFIVVTPERAFGLDGLLRGFKPQHPVLRWFVG